MGVELRLLTGTPRRLADFYTRRLGFTERLTAGDDVYVELERDGSVLGIYNRDLMEGVIDESIPRSGGFVVVIDVPDVDTAFERLRAEDVRAAAPPTSRDAWGLRTAHVRDPDGNLVELHAVLPRGA